MPKILRLCHYMFHHRILDAQLREWRDSLLETNKERIPAAMSTESDFFRSGQAFQGGNATLDWFWPVPAGLRCLGVSFFPDSGQATLTINRLGYEKNAQNNTVLHFNMSTASNGAFFGIAATLTPNS